MGFDDLYNQGPEVDDADADVRTPLGVPKGYTVTREQMDSLPHGDVRVEKKFTIGTPGFRGYFKGDEFAPSSFSTEDRARLQMAMRAAGLFGPKQRFTLGVWDETTRATYRKLLEYANGAGLEWQDALRDYAQAKEAGLAGDEETRAPLVLRQSNPADLAKVFDNAGQATIGRRFRPDEIQRLVAAYHAEQAREQQSAYNLDPTGGTVTEAMNPSVFAEQQARQVDPVGAQEMDTLGAANEFFQLLTSERTG